jgi:hypothetical protein
VPGTASIFASTPLSPAEVAPALKVPAESRTPNRILVIIFTPPFCLILTAEHEKRRILQDEIRRNDFWISRHNVCNFA